jgi:hypothetical protein
MPDPTGVLRGLLPGATPPADGVYPRISVAVPASVLGVISAPPPAAAQQPIGQVTLATVLTATHPPTGTIPAGTPVSGSRSTPGAVPSVRS